jgi:saccharopine dehydrogenase-like NADP-dependent oxidoreductase
LPRHIDGLSRAINLGVVVPFEYFQLTMAAVRLGICTEEPITVEGMPVIGREFAVEFIRSQRPSLLKAAGIAGPRGCLKVEVTGRRAGDVHTYEFSMASGSQGAGEGTGIPAGLGTMLMLRRQLSRDGVFPPEAGVTPTELIALAREAVARLGGGDGLPLTLKHRDSAGTLESIDLPS